MLNSGVGAEEEEEELHEPRMEGGEEVEAKSMFLIFVQFETLVVVVLIVFACLELFGHEPLLLLLLPLLMLLSAQLLLLLLLLPLIFEGASCEFIFVMA